MKKDGLLSTEKNSVDEQDHRSTSQHEVTNSRTEIENADNDAKDDQKHVDHLLDELPEVFPPFLPAKSILD